MISCSMLDLSFKVCSVLMVGQVLIKHLVFFRMAEYRTILVLVVMITFGSTVPS